jgi:EmrB/QacA subfamily drug resistance transporter
VLGPAIGGWITDNSSWRWIFYVNIPVGLLALLVLIFLMPSLHSQRTGKAMIDYVGAVLLIIGTVPFLLGFTWAGSQYAWLSPQILSLFAAALVFLTAFFLYERRLERNDAQPIIDPSLFKNRIFSVSIIITAITGMGMFGCIVFLPLYSQGVLGISATNSGLRLIPLMGGLILSSIISGMLVSRFGKYKWIAFTGMIITVGGSLLLQQLNVNSTTMDLIISMIVLGLGLGFSMSIYTVIVQNALPQKIGQATSGLTFFRSIGGTVAVAAMGSVLNSSYIPEFHKALPAAAKAALGSAINTFDDPNILLSADSQRKVQAGLAQQFGASWHPLYNQLTEAIKVGLTNGIHNVFVLSTIIMCFAFIALFFLKEIPLSGDRKSAMRNEGLEDAESAMVSMVPFE